MNPYPEDSFAYALYEANKRIRELKKETLKTPPLTCIEWILQKYYLWRLRRLEELIKRKYPYLNEEDSCS